MRFIPLKKEDSNLAFLLASEIWQTTYSSIISEEQIHFMLNEMYNAKTIEKQIGNNEFWYFIVHDNQKIGFLHFLPKEEGMYLSKIYLKKEFQGEGLGKSALHFVLKESQILGFGKLFLRVNKNNEKAIKSYKNFGFEVIKEDVLDIGNGFVMDDYILEYKIK